MALTWKGGISIPKHVRNSFGMATRFFATTATDAFCSSNHVLVSTCKRLVSRGRGGVRAIENWVALLRDELRARNRPRVAPGQIDWADDEPRARARSRPLVHRLGNLALIR